jgi:hypothetical protein
MLQSFDRGGFRPHGLLQSLVVQLGGMTIFFDVELVYSPLDYNLLLMRIWFNSMTVVTSSFF